MGAESGSCCSALAQALGSRLLWLEPLQLFCVWLRNGPTSVGLLTFERTEGPTVPGIGTCFLTLFTSNMKTGRTLTKSKRHKRPDSLGKEASLMFTWSLPAVLGGAEVRDSGRIHNPLWSCLSVLGTLGL